MKKYQVELRIYLAFAIIFLLTILSILYIVHAKTNEIVTELTTDHVQSANKGFVDLFQTLHENTLTRAQMIANDLSIADIVKHSDRVTLKRMLENLTPDMDFASICNAEGIVLARTHNDIVGDNISGYSAVSDALKKGVPSNALEVIHNVGLSIYASAPIYDGDTLIGAINCNYSLTNSQHLDMFKSRNGCEATIFLRDTRINTTIKDEHGSRIIGTKAHEAVTATVIGKGEPYTGQVEITGRAFGVYYSPMASGDKTIGMLFTGVDIESTIAQQRNIDFWIFTVSILYFIMSGVIIAFANRAIWKYNQTLAELSKKEEALSILEKILHAMDVYVYITELDTDKILFVNNAMLEGFGIRGNIIGEQCWKVFQANHFEQCDFCAKKKLALAPDTSVVWEEYNTLTCRHYKNTDSVIDWPDGSKVHFQQSIDITDMKRAEAERMEALDRAERASRVKGEFLSRMSHEMRTPMNAVINMMQLAKNTHEADKRTQYLEKGDMASRHLLALINDVLNFTMLDDGTFTLETSVFSFETMMQDVLKTIEIYLEEKKQTISSSIDAAIPPDIVGDEKHLAQVIIKLLVNANKFTPENGVIQFKACVRSDEEETLTLQVEISDSGIGIPKEQQARIFDSFEQADGGASRKFGGIGLGLPIAKRIVELMGGDMWVESEPGQGAKFSFTFIAEKKPALRHDGTDEPQDAASADQPADPFDGTVALLVDDVEINREIVLAVFEQTPMRIECAENGRQALELFSANPGKYDIIFMDINMPEMDGMEATQKIRALDAPEGARVPILAMTANSLPEDVKTYLQIGMNDHIGKPVQINDLVSKSAKYICDYLKTKATPSP